MIRKLELNEFDTIYELLKQCFPSDEYRTYDQQRALLDNPYYQIYVLSDENKQIKAFMAIFEFEQIAHIEHFAVNPLYRNGGLGSKMLNDVVALLNKRVCLEVELPDNEMASRRIAFYKRNNFYLNEYPYMQPPMSLGKKAIPLFIMTSQSKVRKEEFNKIKTLLYTKVYNQDRT